MTSENQTYEVSEPWNQSHFLKFCPGEYFSNDTVCESGREKLNFYNAPAWINMASSLIALIGCILILITYHQYPSFRTGSRKIASCLALSNLFLALGSIVGSLNYLVYRYQGLQLTSSEFKTHCTAFVIICQLQALVTWTSTLASFVWTVILAVFLYLALAKGSIAFFSQRSMWWGCYALSLAVPLFVITPIAGAGFLGYSPYGNGGACFITSAYVQMTTLNESNESTESPTVVYQYNGISTGLLSYVKGLEVLSYVVVTVLFSVITWKMWRNSVQSSESLENRQEGSISSLPSSHGWDWRLSGIPFAFVFLRMWGTVNIFLSVILDHTNAIDSNGCVSKPLYGIFFALTILQAIGDPGQGWANTILFVFLSPNVRRRLFHGCCQLRTRLRAKLSISHLTSHLTSPVAETEDGETASFATSYRLQPSSSSSLSQTNPAAVDLQSLSDSHNDSPSLSWSGSRQGRTRLGRKSPSVASGNSSIITSLFLDN